MVRTLSGARTAKQQCGQAVPLCDFVNRGLVSACARRGLRPGHGSCARGNLRVARFGAAGAIAANGVHRCAGRNLLEQTGQGLAVDTAFGAGVVVDGQMPWFTHAQHGQDNSQALRESPQRTQRQTKHLLETEQALEALPVTLLHKSTVEDASPQNTISGDAHRLRASQNGHAIEHARTDGDLDNLRANHTCPQEMAGQRRQTVHQVFHQRALLVAADFFSICVSRSLRSCSCQWQQMSACYVAQDLCNNVAN